MNEAGQGIVAILGLVYLVGLLVVVGWGFYIAYLVTRALRKYLRT